MNILVSMKVPALRRSSTSHESEVYEEYIDYEYLNDTNEQEIMNNDVMVNQESENTVPECKNIYQSGRDDDEVIAVIDNENENYEPKIKRFALFIRFS